MKRTITFTLCLLFLFQCPVLFSQQVQGEKNESLVGLNSDLSGKMMDPSHYIRKSSLLLDEKKAGNIRDRQLVLGASIIGLMDYQKSNMDDKFGYLMRHPTSNNQIGNTVTEAVLHSFQVGVTASVNNWISMYGEILYDPQQSFGPGTITALTRNQLQLRKGMIIFGDLSKFPLYGAIGKMDTPFGDMGTVSPFTNTSSWHAFAGLSFGAELGYKRAGLHASVMAIQGGSQFRAAHTGVNGTNVPSRLNNFAADVNYTFPVLGHSSIQFGGSYMLGSAYCTGFPITHFGEPVRNNPAYSAYTNVHFADRVLFKAGFSKTFDTWPGSYNPNPPLNQYYESKVSSLNAGVKVNLNPQGQTKFALTAEYSDFRTGPEGSPWERQNQKILGFETKVVESSILFLEVFSTEGYVPLNFMTGGNMPSPGETHSERDAFSNGLVLGARIVL